jgi:hypothetical protein
MFCDAAQLKMSRNGFFFEMKTCSELTPALELGFIGLKRVTPVAA